MKKIILPLLFVALSTACVDSDYDLSKVTTDNITIGGDGSTFRIPLAEIRITLREIAKSGIDIEALFKETDTWLPSTLPGGVDYVDLTKLEVPAYTSQLTDALITQLKSDDAKLSDVTDIVWDKYKETFITILRLPNNIPAEQFKSTFKTAFRQQTAIQDEAKRLAGQYFKQIKVEPVSYAMNDVNIDDDVLSMLCDNLDLESTPVAQRRNTLHIYGEVTSLLPLSVTLNPRFHPTRISFPVVIDAKSVVNKIAESESTQLFGEDLRKIVDGVDFNIPFQLEKYYPKMGFKERDKPQLIITLRMVKRGGLQVNI